jgi:hypothetical protein
MCKFPWRRRRLRPDFENADMKAHGRPPDRQRANPYLDALRELEGTEITAAGIDGQANNGACLGVENRRFDQDLVYCRIEEGVVDHGVDVPIRVRTTGW